MSREDRPDDDLIVAAADNWDHNEATFSGKQSTHAMTSVLVTESREGTSDRIPRVPDRSVDLSTLPGEAIVQPLVHLIPPLCNDTFKKPNNL